MPWQNALDFWEIVCLYSAHAGLAQLVEHFIRNEGVAGSNPVAGTTKFRYRLCRLRNLSALRSTKCVVGLVK